VGGRGSWLLYRYKTSLLRLEGSRILIGTEQHGVGLIRVLGMLFFFEVGTGGAWAVGGLELFPGVKWDLSVHGCLSPAGS